MAPTFTDCFEAGIVVEISVVGVLDKLGVVAVNMIVVELENASVLKVSFQARKGAASDGLLLKNAPA